MVGVPLGSAGITRAARTMGVSRVWCNRMWIGWEVYVEQVYVESAVVGADARYE